VETRNSKSNVSLSKSSAWRGRGNAKEGLQEDSGARVMREMVRTVINTRQCDIGTREGLPELGIIEVRGGARGFRKYEGDRLNGG
jgi:hypothetical protein